MQFILNGSIVILLVLFSGFALVVPGLSNACLFLLVLCGVGVLCSPALPDAPSNRQLLKRFWPLFLVLMLPALAVLLHQLGGHDYEFKDFDRPLRLAVFALVFFAVWRLPSKKISWLSWMWVVALVACFVKTWWITDGGQLQNTGSLGFMAAIAFSNMTILIATWLLLSLRLDSNKPVIVIKLMAVILACYVTLMIKTRGTWLVLPFFSIFFIFYLKELRLRYKLMILVLPIVLLGIAASQSEAIYSRLAEARTSLSAYADVNERETSTGQRLELWRASLMMFEEHPIIGVGRSAFKSELHRLAAEKRIVSGIVEMPHSHNGIFFQMALWGTGGLLALLLVYFVPLIMFCRELRHPDPGVRTYASMGATLCIGFFVFDLTDVMFFWVILNGFYTINLAIFLVGLLRCKANWNQANTTRYCS